MYLAKIKKYAQLGIIVFLAVFVSNFLMSEVFINKSPVIRKDLKTHMTAWFNNNMSLSKLIALITGKTARENEIARKKIEEGYNNLQKVAFTQIAPGVKVRASENFSETSYDVQGVKWIKHKVVVDGIEHEYGWPEGKELPSQSMLENMFR